jgi:hypothetical protein
VSYPSPDELEVAFNLEDADESIRRVKDIVSRTLRQADRDVDIIATDYFNHSYVPDLVIEWPRRGANARRQVYLRPTSDPLEIRLDVKEHASQRPLFIHLSKFEQDGGGAGSASAEVASLASTAKETRSLVTDVGSFRELSAEGNSATSQLLPSSVLRGGVGVLEESQARDTARTVSEGFEGAMEADREATGRALNAIEEILDPSVAMELSTFFESMWFASGGSPLEFPGLAHDLGSGLTPTRLRALIEVLDQENEEFWRRVGLSIDLSSFEGLHLVGSQPALQILMTTALPHLFAKTCSIRNLDEEGRTPSSFIWQVEKGCLSLRGYGRHAWVAARRGDLPWLDDRGESNGPSALKLTERTRQGATQLTSVELVGNGRSVTYRSEDADDFTGDSLASTFDDALGGQAEITKASSILGAERLLEIDFRRRIAFGHTNSRLEVPSLLWTTWTMLNDCSSEEVHALFLAVQLSTYGDDDERDSSLPLGE